MRDFFFIILSIKMLIFWFWHINKINEATLFFILAWKKYRWGAFETDDGGPEKHFFLNLALVSVAEQAELGLT